MRTPVKDWSPSSATIFVFRRTVIRLSASILEHSRAPFSGRMPCAPRIERA
jgi:hypothetical protein